MYEELINKKVKMVFNEGDGKPQIIYGVLLGYEDGTIKINISGITNYFEKKYVVRIKEAQGDMK